MLQEEQEEIISNLMIQLQNQKRLTSLKTLCVRKVADSLPLYEKKGLTKLSPILPETVHALVVKEFLKASISFKKDFDLGKILIMLAEDGIVEFDSSFILNFLGKNHDEDLRAQFETTFFEILATGSPKLKYFVDTRVDASKCSLPKQTLSEHYSLQLMSNLVVLENNFYPVKDADLQVIGLCLPLLQRLLLFARLETKPAEDISYDGLKCLANLKSLKNLTFMVEIDKLEKTLLVKECLLLMPRVNTMAKSKYRYATHKFPSYERQVELGLEHLVLGSSTVIPSNVILPNVTEITVNDHDLTIPLSQFEKLRSLSFAVGCDDWQKLKQHLSKVGHLLKKLSLFKCTCNLVQVLQLCPNLDELNLYRVEFFGSFDVSLFRSLVQDLKRFKFENVLFNKKIMVDTCGLLYLLLTSCPQLEKLVLSGINFKKSEIDLINADMAQAGALAIQKLQEVDIFAFVDRVLVSFCNQFCITYI